MQAPLSEAESVDFDRAYVKQWGLYGFVRLAWPLLEPAKPFADNWHLEEVCNHFEAVSHGLVTRLLVNVPPGTGKSISASVCWCAWTWTVYPEKKFIFVTYSPGLSTRDARKCRELIESDWYRRRWPNVQLLDRADNDYRNSKGGWRFSTAIRGEVTGRHADIQCVDDPIKAQLTQGNAAITRTEIDYVNNFWDGTMPTRMADPKTSARAIIMQRLHDDDLSGHVLQTGEYEHLCLPMRFEPARASRTKIGGDRRTQDGELLHEARYGEAEVAKLERDLNVYADGQLQQRPGKAGGNIFRREWLRFWGADGRPLPDGCTPDGDGFDEVIVSWDMTFKDAMGSDMVCGSVYARKEADIFLLARVCRRLSFANTVLAFVAQVRRFPQAGAKLIEDKANGPAVISTLQRKVPGLIAVPVQGSKLARANAVSYLHQAGNVYYPSPKLGPQYSWVSAPASEGGHIESMVGFPLARFDDPVDAETQALRYLSERHNALFDALDKMKGLFQ